MHATKFAPSGLMRDAGPAPRGRFSSQANVAVQYYEA